MIKRIFKILLFGFLAIVLLSIITYFSFLGWEYITGGKYVEYINQNKETVGIDDSFSYTIMENDIEKNKLILVGEIHGSEEPSRFDLDFFKHLYTNFGVRHYMAELDFAQASLMNTYMESGDEMLLNFILKNWSVLQGRNNKDYYDKYKAFHQFYKNLPKNDKFRFIGIDKIQDWDIMTNYINILSATDSALNPIVYDKETGINNLKERVQYLSMNDSVNPEKLTELAHLLKNIEYKKDKVNREKVLFQNFHDIYIKYNLSEEKLYGYFGLAHVFQYRINGNHPMASQIRMSDLGLENKILSMNFLMVDSYMVVESKMLPEFMRKEGKYSKLPISADNVLFMYIYGIRDFKRSTPENFKSIVKMNGENNPYSETNRLNTTIQLLPVTGVFEMTDKGKPYIQYTIFVRNSDWAEPMEE